MKPFIWMLFLPVGLHLTAFGDSVVHRPRTPNVLLVVCDTLRADHLGCYGGHSDVSTHLDMLSEAGFVFENAYSQAPCTTPSMWNISTSKYQAPHPTPKNHVTLAEYFKSMNYATGAFIAQHHLEKNKSHLHQGFDRYDADSAYDIHGLTSRRAESVTTAAISWIASLGNKPFFAWLVYFDPHDPYIPPEGFKGYYNQTENFSGDRRAKGIMVWANKKISPEHKQFLINAYDEEIRYFDYELGRLVNYLHEAGVDNKTIIIVTADHGEELGDNGNLWDHCMQVSDEEIWVPLIIKMPKQMSSKRITDPVQTIDIFPTCVEYFSFTGSLPKFYPKLEGRSFLALIKGEQRQFESFAASFWRKQQCLISGGYKLWVRGDNATLYKERTNERVADAALHARLQSKLSYVYSRYILKKNYYKKTIDKLKAIGYIE